MKIRKQKLDELVKFFTERRNIRRCSGDMSLREIIEYMVEREGYRMVEIEKAIEISNN